MQVRAETTQPSPRASPGFSTVVQAIEIRGSSAVIPGPKGFSVQRRSETVSRHPWAASSAEHFWAVTEQVDGIALALH